MKFYTSIIALLMSFNCFGMDQSAIVPTEYTSTIFAPIETVKQSFQQHRKSFHRKAGNLEKKGYLQISQDFYNKENNLTHLEVLRRCNDHQGYYCHLIYHNSTEQKVIEEYRLSPHCPSVHKQQFAKLFYDMENVKYYIYGMTFADIHHFTLHDKNIIDHNINTAPQRAIDYHMMVTLQNIVSIYQEIGKKFDSRNVAFFLISDYVTKKHIKLIDHIYSSFGQKNGQY